MLGPRNASPTCLKKRVAFYCRLRAALSRLDAQLIELEDTLEEHDVDDPLDDRAWVYDQDELADMRERVERLYERHAAVRARLLRIRMQTSLDDLEGPVRAMLAKRFPQNAAARPHEQPWNWAGFI